MHAPDWWVSRSLRKWTIRGALDRRLLGGFSGRRSEHFGDALYREGLCGACATYVKGYPLIVGGGKEEKRLPGPAFGSAGVPRGGCTVGEGGGWNFP